MSSLLLLLGLTLLNGLFAMAEIALVSARKARLTQLAEDGSRGAARALELSADPTRLLSTVQVGITSIGILSGAIGESAIADRVRVLLERIPALAPHAGTIALVVMVVVLTYASLILGELVPKRLGLTRPERVAAFMAGPMSTLASAGRPMVRLLTWSTNGVLRLLRVHDIKPPSVTNEEIRVLMQQGTEEGIFDRGEQALVSNVLHLDERQVGAVLTPRADIVFLDADGPLDENRATLAGSPHSVLPLCRGSLDEVVGFVRSTTVLGCALRGEPLDLVALASPPLFVPKSITLMALLQQLRRAHLPMALVVDEFGGVVGLVSLTDVTAAIVGELAGPESQDPDIVERPDGSLLVDGGIEVSRLEEYLGLPLAAPAETGMYHTLGGLTMFALGRVPRVGERFAREGVQIEVVDMDANRVDRLLVTAPTRQAPPA